VLAIVLKLLLQPLVNLLEQLRVPKPVGALIALAVLLSVFVGLGMLLSSPAAEWASGLPQAWPQLQQKFAFIKDPVEHIQRTLDQMGVQLGSPSAVLSVAWAEWMGWVLEDGGASVVMQAWDFASGDA
jgi:predicted PurR-regulated permease PerM